MSATHGHGTGRTGGRNVAVAAVAPGEAPLTDHATASERMPLRQWLRTTPGLVRLFSVLAVVGLVAVWITGTGALTQRRDAAERVATNSGPQLATASDLYTELAAADATASNSLLHSGSDLDEVRDRYLQHLEQAQRLLVDISQRSDASPTAHEAARTIGAELATYAGRVDTARANSRFGNTVGAAYMRAASGQMRNEILPAATTIWRDTALRLSDDYAAGTSSAWSVAYLVAGAAALVALVALAAFLIARTRRWLNAGLLAATVMLLVAGAASLLVMAHEHHALMRAHQDGSDPMQTISAASFLALQGQADVNLALAERDTRTAYLHEFDVLAARIAGTDGPGLLDDARTMDERTDESEGVAAAAEAFDAYLLAEDKAVRGQGEADLENAAAAVNTRMAATSDSFEQRFTTAAADARVGSDLMVVVLAVVLAAAVASVLVGVQPRIGEYR